eukprot:TRINITY_DN6736_c0_g1_i6.p1 TRINITY_DN6736_c0_g1~~TRINITY_DN6736_c0_g1_i6.p1  ORF type:complete len:776 (+),score=309.02 TRINITY_DN6736_c0_g1_i6:112-2439(+)
MAEEKEGGRAEEHGESPPPSPRRVRIREAAATDPEPRKRRRRRRRKVVVNTTFCRYDLVRRVAEANGFVEDRDEEGEKGEFDLFWTDTSVNPERIMRLQNYQRINHFPGMHLISRKVHLATTLGKMRRQFPEHFAFSPRTWSLKSERNQFRKHVMTLTSRKTFIVKPSAGCQGKGIMLTQDPLDLEDDIEDAVVQEYLAKPLLVEGKKFDLRVYALVTSLRHPSVFVFNDGLVRLCTVDYTKPAEDNIENVQMHLTNYAINKTSENFVFNADECCGDTGHKRDFNFLNRWLRQEGHDVEAVWTRIDSVIVKTILAALPQLAHVYNSCLPHSNDGYTCFEVLGFDLLLDQSLKPWLLEVNHSPSFHTDTPLDERIKTGVISEAVRILNLQTDARAKERERERDEFRRRIEAQTRRNLAKKAGDGGESELRALERERKELEEQERRRIEELVTQKRREEDSLLLNYRRVYPSEEPDTRRLHDMFVDAAREANIPQTTQATAQREAEGRRERERQRERQAEEAALRRGPGRPQGNREKERERVQAASSGSAADGEHKPPREKPDKGSGKQRGGSAGTVRDSGSPREREADAKARMQQRLAEQMERHRRRISLGPRLSVFQLREQYVLVPPSQHADDVGPLLASQCAAGDLPAVGLAAKDEPSTITLPRAVGLSPPPSSSPPPPPTLPSSAVRRASSQPPLPPAAPQPPPAAEPVVSQWPAPQYFLQCGGRQPVPVAYVSAPRVTAPATTDSQPAPLRRQLPVTTTSRAVAAHRARRQR